MHDDSGIFLKKVHGIKIVNLATQHLNYSGDIISRSKVELFGNSYSIFFDGRLGYVSR